MPPNQSDYDNAAKKSPSARTTDEQRLVDRGISLGMQSVKNNDHAAQKSEKIHGK